MRQPATLTLSSYLSRRVQVGRQRGGARRSGEGVQTGPWRTGERGQVAAGLGARADCHTLPARGEGVNIRILEDSVAHQVRRERGEVETRQLTRRDRRTRKHSGRPCKHRLLGSGGLARTLRLLLPLTTTATTAPSSPTTATATSTAPSASAAPKTTSTTSTPTTTPTTSTSPAACTTAPSTATPTATPTSPATLAAPAAAALPTRSGSSPDLLSTKVVKPGGKLYLATIRIKREHVKSRHACSVGKTSAQAARQKASNERLRARLQWQLTDCCGGAWTPKAARRAAVGRAWASKAARGAATGRTRAPKARHGAAVGRALAPKAARGEGVGYTPEEATQGAGGRLRGRFERRAGRQQAARAADAARRA
ncbi:unnamed protein product [Closterium sp. NIES-54]